MKHFEITHIIDNQEWENKLEELSQRCKNLNGWSEKDLLQFVVNSYPMYKVWLMFLEDKVIEMENAKKNKLFWDKILHKDNKKDG